MDKQFRDLQLQQTDALLEAWKDAHLSPRPRSGWVHAIRKSLGMTAVAFARRLGMTPVGARKLEHAEATDSITLSSLRKLAQALDCEVHYVLLPRTSLQQQVKDQAEALARQRLHPIAHSMALEDQAVPAAQNQHQIELAVKQLIEGSRRELW